MAQIRFDPHRIVASVNEEMMIVNLERKFSGQMEVRLVNVSETSRRCTLLTS
jgi:hypothetical protein